MSESTLDDKLNLLAQLFWVFVSLLESDYEYEFLMALRCLDKVRKWLRIFTVCNFPIRNDLVKNFHKECINFNIIHMNHVHPLCVAKW